MACRARASWEGVLSTAGSPGPRERRRGFPEPSCPLARTWHTGVHQRALDFSSHSGMGGKPFTHLSDALSFIERAKNQPADIKDLYFCLSLQAKTGPIRNGKPTALRKARML